MSPDVFEQRMRAGECYHGIKLPPACWTIIRVDGRSFTRMTNDHYKHPFDFSFHMSMCAVAQALTVDFGGALATVHSDEISVLLPRDWGMFDREVEKSVSVAAGVASAHFSAATGHVGAFDGRAWVGATDEAVVDYYRWRQADATCGAINSMAYWALRDDGLDGTQASRILLAQNEGKKHDLLHERGINFNEQPIWMRRGSLLHWATFEREGYNPIKEETVTVSRRALMRAEPPKGDEFSALLRHMLCGVELRA